MNEDAPLDLLRDENLAAVVMELSGILDAHTPHVTPAGIEAVRRSAPLAWAHHIPLLIDVVVGTRRAVALGKGIDGWLFTPVSAQQATHPRIAEHHAARYAGLTNVVEVCTGAGIDTQALALVCTNVTTFESNLQTAAIAEGNLRRTGITNVRVMAQHAPSADFSAALRTADGLWADPARRDVGGRRSRSGSTYDPPLGLFTTVADAVGVVGIKVGPGDVIDADASFRFASEYIGWRDECRERVLWRGVEAPSVTLVDVGHSWKPHPQVATHSAVADPLVGQILVEPHAAVIACGETSEYFTELKAAVMDHRIAYGLCTADPGASPLHRRFIIEGADHGIDVKHIQRTIRTLGWGSGTEIKKRGVDVDPMALHAKLQFADGGTPGVILLARGATKRWTIYAKRML